MSLNTNYREFLKHTLAEIKDKNKIIWVK